MLAWFAVEDLRGLLSRPGGAGSAVTGAGQDLISREIGIEGMTCQNCVRHVETALRGTEGVTGVEVSLEPARAVVVGSADEENLREAIAGAGFRPL